MIQLTKIFHFEMAHAIYGYQGACKNIHGHSYELHVSVSASNDKEEYIPAPGFIIDFSEIKQIVNAAVVWKFDHALLLSEKFLAEHPSFPKQDNLVIFKAEPTVENLLVYIKQALESRLPEGVKLVHLKLYETSNSYAEWTNSNNFKS